MKCIRRNIVGLGITVLGFEQILHEFWRETDQASVEVQIANCADLNAQ